MKSLIFNSLGNKSDTTIGFYRFNQPKMSNNLFRATVRLKKTNKRENRSIHEQYRLWLVPLTESECPLQKKKLGKIENECPFPLPK